MVRAKAWRETALTLISPVEYRLAESTYDGEAYSMAVELGVTMQVLKDYQTLLEQRVTSMTGVRMAVPARTA